MLGLEETFDASSGRLTRLKERNGIREMGPYGEKLNCEEQAPEHFKDDFEQFLQSKQIPLELVCNADEIELLRKYFPAQTQATIKHQDISAVKNF